MSMKRNAVHVAAVRTQVHLVVPHLIAVNIGVNVPADAVVFVQVYPAEIIPFPEGCKYGSGLNARDRFSTVLAAGLVTLIAVQTILNLCVVTNLLPSTGIALPFFSYGGTALAVNLGEMGIVLGISRGRNRRKIQEA